MRTCIVAYVVFLCCIQNLCAQNIEYARRVIKDLGSEQLFGRGYVKEGDKKAAEYIRKEYQEAGLLFFDKDFYQEYGFQINSFPYNVSLKVEDRELVPGEEFIVDATCPNVNGNYELFFVDSSTIDNSSEFEAFQKKVWRNTFLVVDGIKGKKLIHQDIADKVLKNGFKARGLIYSNQEKLTWSAATEWAAFPIVYLLKGSLLRHQLKINIVVEAELKPHSTQNVIGYFKGTQFPDSFIVFSAHYDHLGMMGRWALFPGANDNASGVAMILDIMNYYKKHPPKYSIAFMAFSGEEAGLFGSYYYTQHPLFELNKISLLMNLDLMATGDKGMTVVNATLFPNEFRLLQNINIANDYLPTVNSRGKAQNSDHYYFSENGVKAFFFYLMGDYHFYHDVYDTPEAVSLSKYNEAFKLIVDFTNEYCGQ